MRTTPAKVEGVDHVTAVVAGDGTTLALRDDGTLWAWGSNGNGQLGDGTAQDKAHPVRVTGLVGAITSVATYAEHALAVTADGSVWAWGWGLYGQLGNGDALNSFTAIRVSGLPAAANVAAGSRHSLALAGDGTVYAWGDNSMGQLGDGSTSLRLSPVRVSALSNIVAISTSANSNLALDKSGQVWAWGYGGGGTLGDGTLSNRATPVMVTGLPPITGIVAGKTVSVAAAADGSVWMWGDNASGQFGDSAYSTQASPARVSGLTGYDGFSVGKAHVVAQNSSGVWAWGGNDYGQLGVGDANDRSVPTAVTALPQIKQVSAGLSHTVAVASDGSVWAWGSNGVGELADGTAAISNRPVEVRVPNGAVAVSAGRYHALALAGDGSVWAWGNNSHGGLGNGSRRDSALPQRVVALPAVSAIAGGNGFSLALEQNGTVWSWGYGDEGQLGNGQAGAQLTPKALTTISGVTQLSAHYRHALGLRQDGSVWAWGTNDYGQLGDGTSANRSTPTLVPGLAYEMIAVAAGTFHSLALDRSGNVWAWGYNAVGQLGDGTEVDRLTPARVVGLSDVVAISAGENTSYAITRDGLVWAWGYNPEGELGTGSARVNSDYPRPIEGFVDFRGIAGGVGSAVALRADGTVWSWGRNFEGQLGDATFAQRNAPVLTVNATASGPLDLNPQVAKAIPPDKIPPFFSTADRSGDLSRISVRTKTKFNADDVGKQGAVFVTATVPPGSLMPAQTAMRALGVSGAGGDADSRVLLSALSASDPFVLLNLTSSGWQPVVNGQLIAYASGVLGDQISAQTILDNADTTNLKGAQFCVGYGTSAAEMIAAARMRAVATIPDPNATGTAVVSCIVADSASTTTTTTTTSTTIATTTTTTTPPGTTTSTTASSTTTTVGVTTTTQPSVSVAIGWNLIGNGNDAILDVAATFSDANKVTTVWKWVALGGKWAFFAPSLTGQALADYAAGKGYDVLGAIGGGEGFWVNAKQPFLIGLPAGNALPAASFGSRFVSGWNLISIGEDKTPAQFNSALGFNIVTLWAWDNSTSAWYFYAPSLEAKGGSALADYIAGKGYLDFGTNNKKLGNGTGFWVNR